MIRISVMTVCLLATAASMQAEDFRVLDDVAGDPQVDCKAPSK